MALPSSGPLTLAQIQTEFGGSNPISLSEYYAGGANVPAGTTGTYGAVPSSGTISIQNFYGTQKVTVSYKGIASVTFPANSYYLAPTSQISYSQGTATNGSYSICFPFPYNVSNTTATMPAFVIIHNATSTFLGAYGVGSLGGYNARSISFRGVSDKWNNLWCMTNLSGSTSRPYIRMIRFNASTNYTTSMSWQYYGASNSPSFNNIGSSPITTDPNNDLISPISVYTSVVDSSGNLTNYNNSPYQNLASPATPSFVNGGNADNNVISYIVGSSLVTWGTPTLLNYFNSTQTLLAQRLIDVWNDTSPTRNISAQYLGRRSNLYLISGISRYDGTTTNRSVFAWFSMPSSASTPTFLNASRANATYPNVSTTAPIWLGAIDSDYDYFFGITTIYKVNSSGIVVQGYLLSSSINNNSVYPSNFDGDINIARQPPSATGAFTGCTTIQRLINNQVQGWTISNYSNYNGQYVYNIPAYPTPVTMGISGTVSYPLTTTSATQRGGITGPNLTNDLPTSSLIATNVAQIANG